MYDSRTHQRKLDIAKVSFNSEPIDHDCTESDLVIRCKFFSIMISSREFKSKHCGPIETLLYYLITERTCCPDVFLGLDNRLIGPYKETYIDA